MNRISKMAYKAKPIYFLSPRNFISEIKQAEELFNTRWLNLHSYEDEKILYHYTNLDGLKGIIDTRSLWFSHTTSLNDPSESEYGKNMIASRLFTEENNVKNDNWKRFFNMLREEVINFYKNNYQTYIACFCEMDNLLSQWRSYANKGDGYNIGFNINDKTLYSHDVSKLDTPTYIILRRVIYKKEEQESLINAYITEINKALEKAEQHSKVYSENGWIDQAAMQASNILYDMIFAFKNPAFSEEKEWRLVKVMKSSVRPESIRFRSNTSILEPYLEIFIYDNICDKGQFPIKSIKLGPMTEEDRAKSSIELFLHKSTASTSSICLNANIINISHAGFSLRSK